MRSDRVQRIASKLKNHFREIPSPAQALSRQFATRLAVFYAAVFGLAGVYLPFFTVWLKATGIEPYWIGVIIAAPAITRFTVLPFVTAIAEQRQAIRLTLIVASFATVVGFSLLGMLSHPLAVLAVFAITACFWTPLVPLTDAYALTGISRFGLSYGPLRLWGSAAFIAGALGCGLTIDLIEARHLIWVMVLVAVVGAVSGVRLMKLDTVKRTEPLPSALWLLSQRGFLIIIAASALIQGSHSAYYIIASIEWQAAGMGGLTIAGLWSIGVLAEIVIFALSPRFTVNMATLVILGGLAGVLRWLIMTQEISLELLMLIQVMHAFTFGLTMLGTMGLLVRYVPAGLMARAQGYLTATTGIVMSSVAVITGIIYAQAGIKVYYLMFVMAGLGMIIMLAGQRFASVAHAETDQPQSSGDGG